MTQHHCLRPLMQLSCASPLPEASHSWFYQPLPLQIAVQAAQARQGALDAAGLEAAAVQARHVRGDVVAAHPVPGHVDLGGETRQIPSVGGQGVAGIAPLHLEVAEEARQQFVHQGARRWTTWLSTSAM